MALFSLPTKALTFGVIALAALSACDAPQPGLTISPEAMANADMINPETVAPAVSPAVAIQTFENFCGRYPANPAATRRAVESAGYYLFVSGSELDLDMYASRDGRPMVATGRQDGAEVCMVLMKEGPSLDRAVTNYVAQKHGGNATSLGTMQTPSGLAENVWVIPNTPPVIYFTLAQTQPPIGRVEAIAVVTQ